MNNLESYPPLFRQDQQPDDLVNDTVLPTRRDDEDDKVPIIDFERIKMEKRDRLLLHEACKNWGVLRLINHGVPLTLMRQLQDQAKQLFALSFETKEKVFTDPWLSYFWGTPALTPSGRVLPRGHVNVQNRVEGFNVFLRQLSQFQTQDQTFDSFRILLEEYKEHLVRLATTLFEVLAENLNLDSTQSDGYLSESTGILRVYRYPKFSESKDDEQLGMEVHTDSSVLSILNQDLVGGLDVLKDNKWVHVKPISGSLVLNFGDMMQAISNDEYISVKHRVKVNKHADRFSICYFVFPAEGCQVRSSRYRPFTYADFQAQVQHDIRTVGYKVGLQRFKIDS